MGRLRPKSLCTKNGPTRPFQWYVSFFPTMVTLVWGAGSRAGGGGGLARSHGVSLFVFGGAYWPLALAGGDPPPCGGERIKHSRGQAPSLWHFCHVQEQCKPMCSSSPTPSPHEPPLTGCPKIARCVPVVRARTAFGPAAVGGPAGAASACSDIGQEWTARHKTERRARARQPRLRQGTPHGSEIRAADVQRDEELARVGDLPRVPPRRNLPRGPVLVHGGFFEAAEDVLVLDGGHQGPLRRLQRAMGEGFRGRRQG